MEQDKIRIAVGTKYSITGTIGRGGMGTVYSAIAKGLNRPVAIKVVVAEDDETKTRFVAETSALSRLHHQNILPLLDSGESEQLLYYVMPLVEGKSLEAILLSCRRLAIPHALSVADAVASALSEAHGHGIIHRDLKPSNILIPIDEEGPHYDKAMVADFSVVGTLRTHTRTTRVGQFYGTPRYMSPEQIKGEAQSTATDVYGLGLLLYEMIFGQSPFDEANDALTLMQLTLTKEVKIPESPRIPEPLEIFLQACLSKEPHRRPKNPSVELLRLRASIGEATAVQTRRVGSSVESPKSSPATGSVLRMVIGSAVFLLSTVVGIGLLIPSKDRQLVVDVAIGFSLVAVGILSAILIKLWLRKLQGNVRDAAGQILFGLKARTDLSQTLAIEVDELISKCRAIDERILGRTVALMIDEYRSASSFVDRRSALVTAVEFLEKLTARLSPWYIKYEKLIVALVSLLGLISGAVKIFQTISKLN